VEGALDTSLYYTRTGLELARAGNYTSELASLLLNKGQALFTAGEPANALAYFTEAMEYILQLGNPYLEVEASHRIGRGHKALGNYPEARKAQQRTLKIATDIKSTGFQSKALLEMAAIDSLEHKHEDFLRHYVQGIKLRDSIWSQENRSRIAELQIIHETEQKEQAIAQLEQKNRLSRFRQKTILGGSLLVIFFLVTVLLYLQKRRTIIHQNFIIKQQEHEKAEAELDANRRELTGKALSLARSDEIIRQLKKDIQAALASTENKSCDELRSAMQLLKSKDNGQQLWNEFEARFNELNEGFINKLTNLYPALSPSEIRLCAMLRIQMSSKDIAEITKRSTRTIEYTRTNARKKMGLSVGDNLVQHLLNI